MKISSKSILSPGRARDPPNSLSTSLSRRLRNSGSIKGGASPAMFPTTAKKRGSGFENPEPSSPKVTCIGQVRVKSKKKQGKKLRSLSRRHSTGEVSFRKLEHPHNGFSAHSHNQHLSQNLGSKGSQNQECSPGQRSNQRWVHLPVTICDALRAFGSEFSCLFPCRTSCSSTTEREKEEKMVAPAVEEGNRQGSCGAVFARWLVAMQDEDGGIERDIELVVGEGEEEEEESVRKSRRHVFEDLEIVNDRIEGHKDEARVSICIPPKNALLLMRCRSDPMKMEALTNRSWEPTVAKNEEEDEELVDDEDQIEENTVDLKEPQQDLEMEEQQVMVLDEEQDQEHDNVQPDEANQDQEHDNAQQDEVSQGQEKDQTKGGEEEESMFLGCLFEEIVNQDYAIQEQDEADSDMEEAQGELTEEEVLEVGAEESTMDEVEDFEETVTEFAEGSETHEEQAITEAQERCNGVLERESEVKEERESQRVLPECLLMMMYEPKLSMEVSKETWVCSTDFTNRHFHRKKPPPPPDKTDVGEESRVSATAYDVMRVAEGRYQPVLQQPARSSCSLPAPPSMATVLEQKLANAVGYEPFVLTRCKSEPMKTAAANLLPESCFWENRKLEPLSRVPFGVGAAGLGF